MSEYQYYEFLAVDRSLSKRQMEELRGVSSRARITPRSFVNEYNFGSLKADPEALLKSYFDVHIYLANWGSAELMIRLPKDAIEEATLKACRVERWFEFKSSSKDWILTWSFGDEDGYERFYDDDGEGWMARLAPIREELLRGDLRSLALGWLGAVAAGEFAKKAQTLEPLSIQGLGPLTAAQESLADYLKVDEDLLRAWQAGAKGRAKDPISDADKDQWLKTLPKAEVQGYLKQLLDGQSALAERALKRRFDESFKRKTGSTGERRSLAEMRKITEKVTLQRQEKETKAEKKAAELLQQMRDVDLAKIAEDFPMHWARAYESASKGQATDYAAACSLLVNLRDAYLKHASKMVFDAEFKKFLAEHGRRTALVKRMKQAGLVSD